MYTVPNRMIMTSDDDHVFVLFPIFCLLQVNCDGAAEFGLLISPIFNKIAKMRRRNCCDLSLHWVALVVV